MMNKIEIFENERATGYDQFVQKWIPNYNSFINQLPKLLNNIEKKEILVVGCGTGNEIEKIVDTTDFLRITGVDPSPKMIEQAEVKVGDVANVKLVTGLVSDLDLKEKYNVATLLLVLHFLKDNGDKFNLLADIAKRLITGATLVIFDITGDKNQIQENLKVLRLLLPDDIDKEQIDFRLKRIEDEFFLVSEERLSELLQLTGFEKPIRFFQSSIYIGWITKKI
ncbi:class I SAM-dependent methyltransferase [Flavobacterium sp. I3-2]|uniref:class I SAM-dependent methyltransferase n=1 Tax=Flavobacterium sp. I3-2 TaxID=2748319 RepID=UPI002105EBF3|nr:class I SAM-dependent methyltransferase [Flavobacterium sp. I3-2]